MWKSWASVLYRLLMTDIKRSLMTVFTWVMSKRFTSLAHDWYKTLARMTIYRSLMTVFIWVVSKRFISLAHDCVHMSNMTHSHVTCEYVMSQEHHDVLCIHVICIYAEMYICICMCVYILIYICICIYTYIHTTCIYTQLYRYIYISIYICIFTYMYICTYMYIYTHNMTLHVHVTQVTVTKGSGERRPEFVGPLHVIRDLLQRYVLQCVAVCCSVLQCVAVSCSAMCHEPHFRDQWRLLRAQGLLSTSLSSRPACWSSALQRVAVCDSMLQCVTVGCSVL